MNLDRAKDLLTIRGIPFHTEAYASEADFWKHIVLFPCTENMMVRWWIRAQFLLLSEHRF